MFDAVMVHYEFDSEEIELAKQAYRNDPHSARRTYAALFREIPADSAWRIADPALRWVPITPPQGVGTVKRA